MKNWWRNKGQFSKNGHLKLVCYTSEKQPDFSQELGLCRLPVCSGGKSELWMFWKPAGCLCAPRTAAFPYPSCCCCCCVCCSEDKWEIQVIASTRKIFVPAFPMVQLPIGAPPCFVTWAWWDRDQPRVTSGCCILFPEGNRDTLLSNVLIVWYPQAFPKFSSISHYFSWLSKMLFSLKLLEFFLEVYSRHRACLSDPPPNHKIPHLHRGNETFEWYDFVVWAFQDLIPFSGIICPSYEY